MRYTGSGHDVLRYSCIRGWLDNGEPRCIAFGGMTVDAAIGREVLRVVQPAAIEASVQAQEEYARQRDDVLEALDRDLQAARYAGNGQDQTSMPESPAQEIGSTHPANSAELLGRLVAPCLASIPADRATGASDTALRTAHFHGCSVPQLYNESRPHRSLGERTPSEFASQFAASRDLTATKTGQRLTL